MTNSVERISSLTSKLDDMVLFLQHNSPLSEYHLVNFITHDLFDSLLPADLADQILNLSDEELAVLPSYELIDILVSSDRAVSHSTLIEFLRSCRRFCVESFLDDPTVNIFFANSNEVCKLKKLKLHYCTSEKKSHEVEEMASAVATTADNLQTDLVVDIGSGRGYLGSLLAMYYGLRVFGFDASDCNTASATKRLEKVQKDWKTALQRAGETIYTDSSSTKEDALKGVYQPITCAVTASTSLDNVIDTWNGEPKRDRILLCGLHTCGDLAVNALRMYVECPRAKGLLLVGCCYHLVEERFASNPFRNEGDPPPSFYGFPLSAYLQEKRFGIGRNTRILASQPVCKMAKNIILPHQSLFWRALVQQMVWDKLQQRIDIFERRVGRVAKRCKNFEEYVPIALNNLGLHLQISAEEVRRYQREYADYEVKLKAFFQLHCALARPVEAVILLDRLCHLLEQDSVAEAKIIPLFDPAVSPRCYALWSKKK